jgi:hypothetical protein
MRELLRPTLIVATGALLLAGPGCSRKSESDFTPAQADARKALESGLRSWKDGGKPGDVPGTSKPTVRAEDPEWSEGRKLKEYEILGDEPLEGSPGRVFTVRIITDKGAPHDAKYVVFGIDPVQVFRDSTYKALSGAGK